MDESLAEFFRTSTVALETGSPARPITRPRKAPKRFAVDGERWSSATLDRESSRSVPVVVEDRVSVRVALRAGVAPFDGPGVSERIMRQINMPVPSKTSPARIADAMRLRVRVTGQQPPHRWDGCVPQSEWSGFYPG